MTKQAVTTEVVPTMAELQAMIKGQQQMIETLQAGKKSSGAKANIIIKPNSKGGIFIRDTRFKAFSDRTNKEYVLGLNLNKHELGAYKILLEDKSLQEAILGVMDTGAEFTK